MIDCVALLKRNNSRKPQIKKPRFTQQGGIMLADMHRPDICTCHIHLRSVCVKIKNGAAISRIDNNF